MSYPFAGPQWYDGPMERIDPEQERQRLASSYSNMTNEQLEGLAADPAALTEPAYRALKDEIERRGLGIDLEDSLPAENRSETRELVTIRRFRDLPEALIARGLLESADIECFLTDDNMVRLDWFISNAIGNMKLRVNKDDAETALEILNQPVLDNEADEL